MNNKTSSLLVGVSAIALSACTQTYNETEGVTLQAGNAVAYNSALQIIDPWPKGVQDTNLIVPADRDGAGTATNGDGNADAAAPIVDND
ncbi:MAG: hypothetical protein AAFY99_05820 [Pseudomonadota bacterium]